MSYCVISPYSRKLRNGGFVNPKDYPYWSDIVSFIHSKGMEAVQIGGVGENRIIGVDKVIIGANFQELEQLVRGAHKWLSVDNFFHHFCASIKVPGIVIFGRSDPNIFGHPINTNLLKDRNYLRPDQFGIWESIPFDSDVFVQPEMVCRFI